MSTGQAGRLLAIVASVVVAVTIVAAIVVMGSPASQRESRLDRKREQDMDRIATAIDLRVKAGHPLPPDLASLALEPGQRLAIADPATGAPYLYEITSDRSYRLCAAFTTDTAQESRSEWIDRDWIHGRGSHCFDRRTKEKSGGGRYK